MTGVDLSIFLFLCAAALTFVRPRLGAVMGCVAALAALPFYWFFVAPRTFEDWFGGEFKTIPSAWDPAALAVIAFILVTTIVSLRRAAASVV